jgi:hypothetical protein
VHLDRLAGPEHETRIRHAAAFSRVTPRHKLETSRLFNATVRSLRCSATASTTRRLSRRLMSA